MSEITKTSIVVGLALLLLAAVWFTRTSDHGEEAPDMRGKELFAEFDDPTKVNSLEIVEYDESTAISRPFKVARVDGSWSIPSHQNYPADAEKHLGNAATDLLGLKVLDIASENQGDHGLYGVIDPDPKTLSSGATGVGTRVVMRDAEDKELVSIVIGKEVPDQRGLRYVRAIGQDSVYVVKVDSGNLSTKFEDWIEKNLLKLNAINIKQINIHDYSIDMLAGRQIDRGRLQLTYDESAKPSWTLIEKQFSESGDPIRLELSEDEEVDTTKINDLKNALDDLKIVDVRRKPKELSGDLKADGSIQLDQESFQSLKTKGFNMVRMGEQFTLLSDNGESRVALKDGVQYVLRFGRIATSASTAAEEKAEEGEEKDESVGAAVNRYLFVMVEFNPDMIELPVLLPLPESTETPDPEKGEENKAEETADPEKDEENKAEETPDPEKDEANKAEETPDLEKSGEEKSESDQAVEEERKRIEKENTRQQEEYEDKVAQGKKAVAELNDRFADWYYVISDDVYQKIHLSRDDLVKRKEANDATKSESGVPPSGFTHGDLPDYGRVQEETFTPDDFQQLKDTAPRADSTVGPTTQ